MSVVLSSVAVGAFAGINTAITVVHIGYNLWQYFRRFFREWSCTYILINKSNCPDIFYGLTIYISNHCKNLRYKTTMTLTADWQKLKLGQASANPSGQGNNAGQKSTRVFIVPKPNDYLKFTVNGIQFEIQAISSDGMTITGYTISTEDENDAALSNYLASIMHGWNIDQESIMSAFPKANHDQMLHND